MADLIYVASLDNKQVLAALKQIDASITKLTNAADKNFQEVGKSANLSGVQIGAVSGVVSSLVTQFIQLGQEAVRVLIEIGQRSIDTAIQFDTLKARLGGIFDGSQEAADQAFNFIQDKSKQLGIDLSELAGAFLPKTESLAQFERVAKIATALARSDPEQGAIGARIALIEALSGTFTSIQRRFEIPKEDINRIKEAFDKEGIEGFLTTLETVLEESGKSFEDLANTAQTSFDRLGIAGQQLGGRLGAPIVEALEEAANKILSFLNENEDDLIIFADTIGRAIADVVRFISSIDLTQFNTQQLIEFADYVFRIVNAVQLAVEQFNFLSQSLTPISELLAAINPLWTYASEGITRLDEALVTLSQILALATASFEAIKAAAGAVIAPLISLYEAVDRASKGDFAGAAFELKDAYDELQTALYDTSIVQNAFDESILKSQAAFDEYNASIDDNKAKQDELRTSLEQAGDAGTGAADAILAAAQAEREAAQAAEELQAAQDKVNKAFGEAEKDFQRKLEDIDIQAERKRLDIQIEFAQKREDAAKENYRKLEDIQRKNQQDLADAATDLERKEQDIASKFANERIDLEREQRQRRVDVEKKYRQTLQDIQREDSIDLEEAERKRDAVTFLRILRQQQQKVNQAQLDRTRELDEVRLTGELRKEELRTQQQRELEEARLTNQRRLEDLRTNLERQIEAQNTAYEQQLEDISTGEQRKNEELTRKREEDIADAKKAYERKLADLKQSLADELTILKAGNAALEEEQNRHNSIMSRVSAVSQAGGPVSQQSSTISRRLSLDKQLDAIKDLQYRQGRNVRLGGRAAGGPVVANSTYLVGEKGPELFTPDASGAIVPNKNLLMALPGSSSVSNISSSRNQQINIPMVNGASLLDPIFIAQLRNIISNELDGLF